MEQRARKAAKQRAYYERNAEARKAYQRGHYAKNQRSYAEKAKLRHAKRTPEERVSEAIRLRDLRLRDPAGVAEYQRTWREANALHVAQYRDLNREANNKRNRNYKRSTRHIQKVHEHRRRASKLNAPGAGVTKKQWTDIVREYNNRCSYCNVEMKTMQMDHVIPLTGGGAHDGSNVVPSCGPCNLSKGSKPLMVWLASGAGPSYVY